MKVCPACATPLLAPTWHCLHCGHEAPEELGFALLAPSMAHAGGGFDPQTFDRLAAMEEGSFWFRSRNRLILWALRRFAVEPARYLEVGCGTGFVLAAIRQAYPCAKLTGSEIFVAGLPHAQRRVPDVELVQMDACRVPYADEFDAIGAFDVLEHIADDERVLRELARALRPGGTLVLTVPQHPWLWSAQDESAHHVRRYRIGELRRKVEDAGLRVEYETSFVSLLLPAMWLSRRSRGDVGDGAQRLEGELTLPTLVDCVLDRVMAVERAAIRLGIRFRAGGSRLLVARRQTEAT